MADNVYNLKFTLSNGDVIDAGQITAPQGPKGDKGDSATIDANTLLALLSGSNGISIAVNSTGDKVEAKLAIPETGPITLASTQVPRPAILINVEQGGPPHAGGISCSREVGGETTYVGPAGIMIDDGAYVLSINNANDSFIAYTDIHGMPLGDVLIGGGPKGNVKTLFGNQSIYGSGNIDLYKHNIMISDELSIGLTSIYCQIISSSNININSLTNLQTILKDSELVCAFGYARVWSDATRSVCGISKTNVYAIDGSGLIHAATWQLLSDYSQGLTFYDTVTTV